MFYSRAPQIPVPEVPSEKGKGAAKGKAMNVRKSQEASRYMPTDVRGLPVRKPGYYKEDHEGYNTGGHNAAITYGIQNT